MNKQINFIVILIISFLFGINVNAQTPTGNNQATTTVNIILADVLHIHDGGETDGSVALGGTVDFHFVTAEHYNNGISVVVNRSLVVTSTSDFNISVEGGDNFSTDIPASVLDIRRATRTTNNPMSGTHSTVNFGSGGVLISGANKGSKLTLDLEYSISGENSRDVLLGIDAGTYTSTVTYTVTAI